MMIMKRKNVNPQMIADLYEKFTGPEIARKLKISKFTVYKKLRQMNTHIRNQIEAQKFRLRYHKIKGGVLQK